MYRKIRNYYNWGGRLLNDPFYKEVKKLNETEIQKQPQRYDIINFLLETLQRDTIYLEIGVRDPSINYDKIKATQKFSVDPGLEFKENPVSFKVTSDEFFDRIRSGEYLESNVRFDVIFIDGLHLAEQVDRDIQNALQFIKNDGYIILHDCNPPTEWHAREERKFEISPAMNNWNGTTWKGYMKWRNNPELYSCTIDTDWGVGVISKTINIGSYNTIENLFYEFSIFNTHRKACLNLVSFEEFKEKFGIC